MLLNQTVAIVAERVVLVPYGRHHVPTYHEWMQDPVVREATASEELSIEKEYEMQESWRVDEDKLTFIVLRRLPASACPFPPSSPSFLAAHDTPSQMLGDVNLFLSPVSPPSSPSSPSAQTVPPASFSHHAEMEIMLPLPSTHRQGLATEVLQCFLSYASGALRLPPRAFHAKVSETNEASMRLFEKLGFGRGKLVEVFQEREMEWRGGEAWGWGSKGEVIEYSPLAK